MIIIMLSQNAQQVPQLQNMPRVCPRYQRTPQPSPATCFGVPKFPLGSVPVGLLPTRGNPDCKMLSSTPVLRQGSQCASPYGAVAQAALCVSDLVIALDDSEYKLYRNRLLNFEEAEDIYTRIQREVGNG